jgi:hypothetical protein
MRKTDRNLAILRTVFAVSLVISNVVTSKLIYTGIRLFGTVITLPGAALCYAITFLATDVIGEIWGKKEANETVLFGFIGQLLATLLIIFTQYLPAADSSVQEAYETMLGQNYIFVIGSLVAYWASQTWDVLVFHKIRDKYMKNHGSRKGGRWIWNNGSTMTSQIIDTVLFIGISFGIGFGWLFKPEMWATLAAMMVGQYALKFVLAALDTPIFYFLTRER